MPMTPIQPPSAGPANFSTLRAGSWAWRLDPALDARSLLSCLEDPAEFFAPPAQLLNDPTGPRSSQVARTTLPSLGEIVVKRSQPKTLWKRLATPFRPAPVLAVWERARQLGKLGIPTPQPLAAGERRSAGFLRESCLVTRAVPGARSVREFYFSMPSPNAAVKPVIRALARAIARLHDAQIAHTDLHLGNFLVTPGRPNQEIFLVDLEALRDRSDFDLRAAAADLRRFWQRPRVRDRERFYFLVAYCRARTPRVSPAELAALIAAK